MLISIAIIHYQYVYNVVDGIVWKSVAFCFYFHPSNVIIMLKKKCQHICISPNEHSIISLLDGK